MDRVQQNGDQYMRTNQWEMCEIACCKGRHSWAQRRCRYYSIDNVADKGELNNPFPENLVPYIMENISVLDQMTA